MYYNASYIKTFLTVSAIMIVLWLIGNEVRYLLINWFNNESATVLIEGGWYLLSFCAVFAVGPIASWVAGELSEKKSSSTIS